MIELKHLRAFVAVAEELSFKRAAERLNLTQPPLTLQIKQLELDVGARLFERGGNRPISLTPAGEAFLGGARATLAQSERAVQEALMATDGRSGRLSVSYTDDFIDGPLPATLAQFARTRPEMTVEHSMRISFQIVQDVSEEKTDLGFICFPALRPQRNIISHKLGTTAIVVLVSTKHPLAGKKSILLQELLEEKFHLLPPSSLSGFSTHALTLFAQAGFVPHNASYIDSFQMAVELVREDWGVVIASEGSIPNYVRGVSKLRLRDNGAYMQLGMIYHRNNQNIAISDLSQMMKANWRQA